MLIPTSDRRAIPVAAEPLPASLIAPLATAIIRPLRPEDERLYADFDAHLDPDDRRRRFFTSLREIGAERAHDLTHFDRRDGRAFAAIDRADGSLLGVSRVHRVPGDAAEFALLVRSDAQGRGIGRRLLQEALAGARDLRVGRVVGFVLRENVRMLGLCRDLGFRRGGLTDDPGVLRLERPV
ncbi:MAG: GNAT family N-acetyltransferase [Methylobacteriaceae bacterium]|nr:GNAT family N-acetyltransferase [Methylobacteriaceae bacterium]